MILKLNASKKIKENEQNYSKNLKNKDLAAMLLNLLLELSKGLETLSW